MGGLRYLLFRKKMASLGPTCRCPLLSSPALVLEYRIALNGGQVFLKLNMANFNGQGLLVKMTLAARDFITK